MKHSISAVTASPHSNVTYDGPISLRGNEFAGTMGPAKSEASRAVGRSARAR